MIVAKNRQLSIARQCELLEISRSAFYYKPLTENEEELKTKRMIDEIFIAHPTKGSRTIVDDLKKTGIKIGRDKVRRMMREMGIEAIYPKKRICPKNKGHKAYPYLLRNMEVTKVDEVWASDITYIPLRHGYAYLTAVIDWHSRYILSWEMSMVMDAGFCVTALNSALEVSRPIIFTTDQGSQYTSNKFTDVLKENKIWISMSGRGRAFDNIIIERLWRTVKYEEVYLTEYDNYFTACEAIEKYITYYNEERRHSSLGKCTPREFYLSGKRLNEKAA
jgi:putative transposase